MTNQPAPKLNQNEPQNNADRIVTARYANLPLAVDEFDHSEWAKAEPVEITHLWSGKDAPPTRHAEVRILWTPEALCVRFDARQIEPLLVSAQPQTKTKTIGLWDRDVCEIFIAPDSQQPNRYFEFEAAPTGEWLDLGIKLSAEGRETDWQFQSCMTTAARAADEQLVITMRIPWSDSIPRPQSGEKWRGNLFRCIGIGDERYLAWQPTYAPVPNFHVPEAFGWLSFA